MKKSFAEMFQHFILHYIYRTLVEHGFVWYIHKYSEFFQALRINAVTQGPYEDSKKEIKHSECLLGGEFCFLHIQS